MKKNQLRVYLLAICLLLVGVACGGEKATPASTATAQPSPSRTATPGAAQRGYQCRAGDKLAYGMQVTADLDLASSRTAGQSIDMDIDAGYTATITAVKGRSATARVQYTKMSMEVSGQQAGQSQTLDLPQELIKRLVVTYRVDPLGKVRAVKLPSAGLDSLSAVPGGATSPFGPSLPAKRVEPGDKWTVKEKQHLPSNPRKVTTVTSVYTFDGWTRKDGSTLARIESVSTVPATETRNGKLTSLKATITYLFDPQAGRLVSADGTMTAQLQTRASRGQPAARGKASYKFEITVTPSGG